MKSNFLFSACLVPLILFGAIPDVYSQSCDFLPPAIQPEWTYESPGIKGYYVGVGLAESNGQGADEQIELAKQSALNDLASGIKISVRNSLTVGIRQKKLGDETITEQDVQQITETLIDTSLQDVQVDSTWLDRKRCIVWIRVKVARKIIEAMQHKELQAALLDRLDSHYEEARNKKASPEERDAALKQAYVLLDEIDFEAFKGKQSKRYYKRLLDNLASRVSKDVSYEQKAESLRKEAESLLLKSASTGDSDEKRKLRANAIGKLREIIATSPIGERQGTSAGEAAAFKIAEIEKFRNNPCEAQLQYEIVRDRSTSDEWVGRASSMLKTVRCTRKNRTTRAWRKDFDGIRTSLICAYDISGDVSEWDKPCENTGSFLQSYGALSGPGTGMKAKEIVKAAYQLDKNNSALEKMLGNKGRVLIFVAKGKIKHRNNPKNPTGKDHQFTGKVYSYLLNSGKVEFKDKYTGTGGWNPVSSEMAMEVLGLNVAKRWKSQYLKHIKNN